MNIYVYSDESGVFDKVHNKIFVFAGLVFLSREEKECAARKYSTAERTVRRIGKYGKTVEIKANTITAKQKGKLYRSLNGFYKFAVVIDQAKVMDSIMRDKKSKQRYLDYVFKIGVKRLLEELIKKGTIKPDEVENMQFCIDEHSTATNGIYELKESLEEEFKRGVYSHNFTKFFPPIFPKVQGVDVKYCNSASVRLIRAADIIANRIYHDALNEKAFPTFDGKECKLFITYQP